MSKCRNVEMSKNYLNYIIENQVFKFKYLKMVYVYRWKEPLSMCLAYEIHLSCHIDKYQIKKHYLEFKKLIEINQKKYPISFELSTEKADICFAFRGKSSQTITLHHFDTYAIPLRHKHCTTRTNDLHRFHCVSVRRTSRWTFDESQTVIHGIFHFSLFIYLVPPARNEV